MTFCLDFIFNILIYKKLAIIYLQYILKLIKFKKMENLKLKIYSFLYKIIKSLKN